MVGGDVVESGGGVMVVIGNKMGSIRNGQL
jgi:hypothetical protein